MIPQTLIPLSDAVAADVAEGVVAVPLNPPRFPFEYMAA